MSERPEEQAAPPNGTITVAAIGDLHVVETDEHRYRVVVTAVAGEQLGCLIAAVLVGLRERERPPEVQGSSS